MRRAWTTLAAVGFTNLQMSMALSMVFVVLPDLEVSFPESSSATLSWAVKSSPLSAPRTLVIGAALAALGREARVCSPEPSLFDLGVGRLRQCHPMSTAVVLCRVVQALGSSLIIPCGAASFHRVPAGKRGLAVSSWAAGRRGGAPRPVLALGGLLIDVGSWRWAFWLNLPLGMAAFRRSRSSSPKHRPSERCACPTRPARCC